MTDTPEIHDPDDDRDEPERDDGGYSDQDNGWSLGEKMP